MTIDERNWAGNYRYTAREIETPTSVTQLQTIVRENPRVHAVGTRHSFNGVGDSDGTIISMASLDRIGDVDRDAHTVTIEGGVRYGELGVSLQAAGFALPNLASLPHISVVGACSTATHGSGEKNASLAAAVRAMEIVNANGDIVFRLARDAPTPFQRNGRRTRRTRRRCTGNARRRANVRRAAKRL